MSIREEEDRPAKPAAHEIGSDLSNLSADELSARIALLEREIARLEEERGRKTAGRTAAENLFKR